MNISKYQNTWKVDFSIMPGVCWKGLLNFIVVTMLLGFTVEEVFAQGTASVSGSPDVLVVDENMTSADVKNATRSNPGLLILKKDYYNSTIVKASSGALTALMLENGTKLEFIDAGDGYVGIAEYAPAKASLVTNKLVAGWNATPLEIYILLAPEGNSIPEALVTDHNLQRARNREQGSQPRNLGIEPKTLFSLESSRLEDDWCVPFNGWTNDWKTAYEGITDNYPASYVHNYPNALYIYPGYPVYAGTGTNRLTYLGACNGDDKNNLAIEIHRWSYIKTVFNPFPAPPTVVWGWVKIEDESIVYETKYVFYSAHPVGRYRARLESETATPVAHFGFGAAWSKSINRFVPNPPTGGGYVPTNPPD